MPHRFEWLGRPAREGARGAIRDPVSLLYSEAVALMTRLDWVEPFALHETMVPAAALSPRALTRIDAFLLTGRRALRRRVKD